MAGRKSQINIQELLEVLKAQKEELFRDNGELHGPTNKCWQNVAVKLNCFMQPKYAYIFVKQNRHNALDVLQNDESKLETSMSDMVSDENDTASDEEPSPDKLVFSITLAPEKWNELQELNPVEYRSSDRHSLKKKYTILKPGWTSVINHSIFKETKMPCSISFKRCKMYPMGSSEKYLTISGHCSTCNSLLKGKEHTYMKHIVTTEQG